MQEEPDSQGLKGTMQGEWMSQSGVCMQDNATIFSEKSGRLNRAGLFCHGLWPQVLTIALVGILLYGHTLHVPWYLDDINKVVAPHSGHGLGQAVAGLFGQRGLTMLTFALNYRFGGLNPVGYHLVNIGIHLGAACFVLLLLRRVFPRQNGYAFFGALLFVAHPLQTQAVTYVVQRMASLSALFFLLALYLFVRGRERLASGIPWRDPRHLACYLGALVAEVLAIIAKENAVILPLALLLFAWFFLMQEDSDWKPLLTYTAPFFLAPLVFGILYLIMPMLHGAEFAALGHTDRMASLEGNSPLHYLVTQFSVQWLYIRLLFLPYGQALDYGYPISRELVTLKSAAGMFGLISLVLLAVRLRRKQPVIAAGILWFFLTLCIESSLLPLDPVNEHRLYLPMFGFAMLLPALVDLLPRPAVRSGLLIAFLLIIAVLTWRRNALWNDHIAFDEDNLRRSPNNERVCLDLAFSYLAAKRNAEALPLLERAVQLRPGLSQVPYLKLPDLYFDQGRYAEARQILEEGIRFYPEVGSLYNSLAVLHILNKDDQGAVELLHRGMTVAPSFAKSYATMGKLLLNQGRAVEAEYYVRQGLALASGDAEMTLLLEDALSRQEAKNQVVPHAPTDRQR